MPDLQTDLDQTILALQKDLSKVSANDALGMIEKWQQHLQGQDFANDLEQLKHAISMGNQAAIADILTAAGTEIVGTATSSTADNQAAQVLELGNLLVQAGKSLK